MNAVAAILALALLCSGCFYDAEAEDCGPGMHYRSDAGCVHSPEAGFTVQMVGTGSYSAMVPYLRLSCLDGDDWMDGLFMQDQRNLTVAVRKVDGDEVLWLQGHDASEFHAILPLKGRDGCNLDHGERWSVLQDPMDDSLAVQVEGEARFVVTIAMALGSCKEPNVSGQSYRVQEFKGEGNDNVALGKTFDRTMCR